MLSFHLHEFQVWGFNNYNSATLANN